MENQTANDRAGLTNLPSLCLPPVVLLQNAAQCASGSQRPLKPLALRHHVHIDGSFGCPDWNWKSHDHELDSRLTTYMHILAEIVHLIRPSFTPVDRNTTTQTGGLAGTGI
ncbi:hypothetical protein BST61_g2278 [Cercospora zeina]